MTRGTKCQYMGLPFDSIPEMRRAQYLMSLVDEGVIYNLVIDKSLLSIELQSSFVLPATPFSKKKLLRAITYTPDYRYEYQDWTIYEDYKALRKNKTGKLKPHIERDSRLRIKLLQSQLGANQIFRVCTVITATPDDKMGFWYG